MSWGEIAFIIMICFCFVAFMFVIGIDLYQAEDFCKNNNMSSAYMGLLKPSSKYCYKEVNNTVIEKRFTSCSNGVCWRNNE